VRYDREADGLADWSAAEFLAMIQDRVEAGETAVVVWMGENGKPSVRIFGRASSDRKLWRQAQRMLQGVLYSNWEVPV
jgi:hypothetical protein